LRLVGILGADRLDSDEVYVRVGSDGRVRDEVERGDVGDVGRLGDRLEGSLLPDASDAEEDLGGTKFLVSVLPGNSAILTALATGGLNRGGDERVAQSQS